MISTNSGLLNGPTVNWRQPYHVYARHTDYSASIMIATCDTVGEAKRFIRENRHNWRVLAAIRIPQASKGKKGSTFIRVAMSYNNPNPERIKRLNSKRERWNLNYDGNCQ